MSEAGCVVAEQSVTARLGCVLAFFGLILVFCWIVWVWVER